MSAGQPTILIVAPKRQTQESSAVQQVLSVLERTLLKQGFGIRVDCQGSDTGVGADVVVYLAFGPDDLPQYPVTVIGKSKPRRIAACLDWKYHQTAEAGQLSDSFGAAVDGELPRARLDELLQELPIRIAAFQYSTARPPRLGEGWDALWAFNKGDAALLCGTGITVETLILEETAFTIPNHHTPVDQQAGVVCLGPVLASYGIFSIAAAAQKLNQSITFIYPGPFIDPELIRVLTRFGAPNAPVQFIDLADPERAIQQLSKASLVVAPGRDTCTRLSIARAKNVQALIVGVDGDLIGYDLLNVSSVSQLLQLHAGLPQTARDSLRRSRHTLSSVSSESVGMRSLAGLAAGASSPVASRADSLEGILSGIEPLLSREQQGYADSIRARIAQLSQAIQSSSAATFSQFRLSVFEAIKQQLAQKRIVTARAVVFGYTAVVHDDAELVLAVSGHFLDARDAVTARMLVEQVLAVQPTSAAAHKVLASFELKLGRPEGAERYFRLALRSAPMDADAFAGLGFATLQRGDVAVAFESFQRALQILPQHPDAQHGITVLQQLVASSART